MSAFQRLYGGGIAEGASLRNRVGPTVVVMNISVNRPTDATHAANPSWNEDFPRGTTLARFCR